MASDDIVGIISGFSPTKTAPAQGGSMEDTSSPVGYFRTMAFDGASTVEYLDVFGYLDRNYSGAGIEVEFIGATSATAGNLILQGAFLNIDSGHVFTSAHSYSFQSSPTVAAPGVAFTRMGGTISFLNTQIDSLAANSPFVLRLKRDPTGSDTLAADFLLLYEHLVIREA